MSNYQEESFTPWQIVDGKCIVADESEWRRIEQLGKYAKAAFQLWENGESLPEVQPVRPTVKVTTDIFEDVEGSIVNAEGCIMFYDNGGVWRANVNQHKHFLLMPRDLFARFFQTVDSTQYVDYLIETKFPELVRSKWPYESEKILMQRIGDPKEHFVEGKSCLLYTSPSPRDS